jgi:tol-pal system protein YbgF
MMRSGSTIAAVLVTAAMAGCADTGGPINGDVRALSPDELRLQNVETKVADLSRRVNSLGIAQGGGQSGDELRALRGSIQELRHDFEMAQQQQNNRLQAIEQRLQLLESGAPGAALPGQGAAGAAPAAGMAGASAPGVPAPGVQAPGSGVPAQTSAAAGAVPGAAVAAGAAGAAPPAATSVAGAPAAPASPAPQEEALYANNLNLLKNGRYDDAAKGFRDMLDQYPQGNYADNAWYWMGEAYYVKRDFNDAQQSFQSLVDRFPASPKVPDALLKIGLINLEQKKTSQGKAVLQRIVKEFPNSKAADVARSKLKTG